MKAIDYLRRVYYMLNYYYQKFQLIVMSFVVVGIVDYLYTTVINPDFAEDYLAKTLENYETLYSGQELETKKTELTTQMENYGGSGFMATVMFLTVVIIGFIISLISGLILQRK